MRGRTPYGKGGATRPRELWELNYELAYGGISERTYYRRKKKLCQK